MEYQPGQLIKVRGVNGRRIAALLVLGLSMAFGLSRTGTTVVTTGETPKPLCGAGGGNGHHGGGTIHIGG